MGMGSRHSALLVTFLLLTISEARVKVDHQRALRELSVWLRGDTVTAPTTIQLGGHLNRTWNGTCAVSGGRHCTPLHVFGIYSDVLSLSYTFEDASAYDFGVPIVKPIGGRATASVTDFNTDVEERRGEVSIEHQCKRLSAKEATDRARRFRGDIAALRRADTTLVSFTLPVARSARLELAWKKVCGHGPHHALDYGVTLPDQSARSLRTAKSPGTVVVGPEATATSVWLRTERGAGAPRFRQPYVRVEGGDGDVSAIVRAWTPGSRGARFVVLYGCGARGRVIIRGTIALPPFDNATFAWTKDCGGGAEPTLRVTSGQFGAVVRGGAAETVFQRESRASGGNTLSHDNVRVTFAVTGREGLNVGTASVESSDEAVVRPRVWVERNGGGAAAAVVVVLVRCRRVGEAHLRITLPVQDRVPAEWSFYKRCVGPQRVGGSRLHAAVALILIGAVLVILGRVVQAVPGKNAARKAVRFERVETRTE